MSENDAGDGSEESFSFDVDVLSIADEEHDATRKIIIEELTD